MTVVFVAAVLGFLCEVQLARALPPPVTYGLGIRPTTVRGAVPLVPWPANVQAAIAVPATSTVLASGPEQPAPVASLTKMMTAYVVIRDHPLSGLSQGPPVMVSAEDQLDEAAQSSAGDTALPVQPGEVLSERQLLDGLLVHSANNYANILARWDAGSLDAFVTKMNKTAASLGMRHTHYVDPSGIDDFGRSTAADQLKVASAAMDIPVFSAVVAQPAVTLPLAGTVPNYVAGVGRGGIVGVKSGFTTAANGCVVLAGLRSVGGIPVVVLAAVIGQPGADALNAASRAATPLLDAAAANLRLQPVLARGQRVAVVSTPWTSHQVSGVVARGLEAFVWPGNVVHRSMRMARLGGSTGAGTVLGTVTVTVGTQQLRAPVESSGPLGGPSLMWRLTRW